MATNKKIQELKAQIETLKAEKADVEARLNNAEGELISAERELRRSEKLTPAMRKVLLSVASGALLMSSRFNLPVSYWLEHDGKHETVRRSVFAGLRSREAIDAGERDGTWRERYQITDHGRSLVA